MTVSDGELSNDTDVEAWRRIANFVHDRSPAKLGLMVDRAKSTGGLIEAVRRADEAGFDVLELSDSGGVLGRELLPARGSGEQPKEVTSLVLTALSRMREVWPDEKPVVVHLSVPEEVEGGRDVGEYVVGFAAGLRARGCDAVAVSPAPGLDEITDRHRVAQLVVSDRIRNVGGITTMLAGGVPGEDEAITSVLSGRADLCRGRPALASPRWDRDQAAQRAPAGAAPLAIAGEAGGSTRS